MNRAGLYVIEYWLHGKPKTFVIRSPKMRNADAWHGACCDAVLAPSPKPSNAPLKMFSKPMAERFGVTNVRWHETSRVDWTDAVTR